MVKFASLDLKERGLHKMIERMNEGISRFERDENVKTSMLASETKYYKWYLDIENLIDSHFNRDDCMLSRLMDRLANFGRVCRLFLQTQLTYL